MVAENKNESPLEVFLEGLENGFGSDAYKAKLLLEAAPDLLAACKAMLADVAYAERIGDPCCVSTKASDLARAAIAKAEGR